jgi:iron complex outermembrane receptor protein
MRTKSNAIVEAQRNLLWRKRTANLLAVIGIALGLPSQTRAIEHPSVSSTAHENSSSDILETDIEDLMKMKVTSVSKRPEQLSDAAAAIHVITQEDIRRSGATSIPEALRLSPGMEVARQDAHTWAISSRGFNDEFANQLLVLMDGRSVYTPLFAGVYWDVQDTILEDIDRIEVIRGPGATLWGANAVNGVINVTTKSAQDTQGLLLTGGGGNEEQGFFAARYGAKVGENGYARVYGKFSNHDESELLNGDPANDSWYMSQGGFRYDLIPSSQNLFTLQGDIYGGQLHQQVVGVQFDAAGVPQPAIIRDNVDVSGANLLGRWTHTFSEDSELALKLYYDRTERDRVVFNETRDTFDIDLQHRIKLGERNDLVWGLGYNLTSDHLDNSETVIFNPDHRATSLYSAFVQDEIALVPDRLRLTLGSKVEHNDYTGWEIQPSGRLSLSITPKQTVWFAASRAVSTPSRAENDIRINQVIPGAGAIPNTLVSSFGSTDMESKELIGFELGYRIQPHDRITFDLATFYNLYDKQRSIEPSGAPQVLPPGYVMVPVTIDNMINGETYGFELASTWQATDWWRLKLNYTFWRLSLHREPGSGDTLLEFAERDSPRHQVGIRSLMDLTHSIEFDTGIRYVDALPTRMRFADGSVTDGVPSYIVGDARIGWRPNKNWEVSLVGQNISDASHQEFAPSYIQTQVTQVETSVFAKITFRY